MKRVRSSSKEEAYKSLISHLDAILRDESTPLVDEVARMATLCSLVHILIPKVYWAGFYRLVGPKTLVVGPYCGTPACLVIDIGRGVCGQCAREGRPVVVPDVRLHPDHIACDAESKSEIVVPVFDAKGRLKAVFDVDSDHLSAFDEFDARQLQKVVRYLA
ncbi:MAG: GAF domain-containing protein [Candidatus Brocadiia bacterium]